jgi:hypothetical protein
MPEAKFRTVKKRETDLRSNRTSEFAAELREREPRVPPSAPTKAAEVNSVTVAQQAAPALAQPAAKAAVAPAAKAEAMPEKKAKKDEKRRFGLISFWPIAVGLFLSGFGPEWFAIATQAGLGVLRFTFPFALLATHREIGINAHMVTVLPEAAVFAQLPIDGALLMLSMLRSKSLMTAILHVTAIHAVCAFVLWLVSTGVK